MSPRVTVLLAVYNGGGYLREAVDSVLAQTYTDFELLVVDDASVDGATEHLPPDPRIRVLRNERNLGQIPSLNRGLREARGEYIARLDHDDVCLARRLERQVQLLDADPTVALAATWVDVVDTEGRLWTHVRPVIGTFAEFATRVVSGQVGLVHPSLMLRRDVVVDLGGFDETLHASEDQDLYRRLVLARKDARVVPETLLRYRRHEQQMTIAKSAAVWESDGSSYDSFLRQLAPATPATTVRLLLRTHPSFWSAGPLTAEELEGLLDAAATGLELDAAERTLLAQALARRAASAVLSGWAGDSAPAEFRRHALGPSAFAARHGRGWSRGVGLSTPVLAATVGAGSRIGAARSRLGEAMRSDILRWLREAARTSRTLRRIYARVIDTRARD